MRLTSIGLYTNDVEVATFALRSAKPNDRFLIRHIIGLDADEITPKFYGFGLNTGAKFYNFSRNARELVFRVILNPTYRMNEEHADIRDELYKAVSATRSGLVNVRLFAGGASVAQIDGFITKLEAGYFNQISEAQLTMRCDEPMLRGTNPVRLEASQIKTTNPLIVADSQSTAPHGFTGQVSITAAIPDFTIQDKASSPDWKLKIIPSGGFLVGDVLHFSSDYNLKALYLIRGGSVIHLLDRIENGSVWPTLFPGSNEFHFVNVGSFTWDYIEYHTAFWGV